MNDRTLRKALNRLHYLLLVMLTCVHCYVAYPLSLRHTEEMWFVIRKAPMDCPDGKTMSLANHFYSLAA